MLRNPIFCDFTVGRGLDPRMLSVSIHFPNWIVRNSLVLKLSGFAEIFTSAPVVSVLEDDTLCNVKYDAMVQKNLSYSKLHMIIKKMSFIIYVLMFY